MTPAAVSSIAASTSPGLNAVCARSGTASLERTHWRPRQIVSSDDLNQDNLYLREKARRHNRMLHGWGIVCGGRVRGASDPNRPLDVVIESGYLLGPYGDEIYLDREMTVDLSTVDLDGNLVSGCAPADPWCADVRVDRNSGVPLYLAVAASECTTRPVRGFSGGCGCNDAGCEYSRIRDGYVIRVLDTLPNTYPATMVAPDPTSPFGPLNGPDEVPCGCAACLACPTEPWVILADLTIKEGAVTIDCVSHRRYVASLASFFLMCEPAKQPALPKGFVPISPELEGFLAPRGIKELLKTYAGNATQVTAISASATKSVVATSTIAKLLAKTTIGQAAAMDRPAFIDSVASKAPLDHVAEVRAQADVVWKEATAAIAVVAGHP